MTLPRKTWRSLRTFIPFGVLGLAACSSCSSSSGGATAGADAGTGLEGGSGSGGGSGSSSGGSGGSGGGGGSSSGGSGGDGGGITGSTASAASWFPASSYFNVAIDTAPLDANSATIISTLVSNGGWGNGALQIDTSIDVYYADSSSK